jgi:hypothetical protein
MGIKTSDLTSAATDDGLDINKEGVVTGSGVFDDLMEAVTTHLDAQFKSGRITGKDYSNVYLGAMQSTIQQSVSFLVGKTNADAQVLKTEAEVSVLGQKEVTEFVQTGVTKAGMVADPDVEATTTSIMGRQSTLYNQQAKGFKWNADQKYLKTIMDAWSINTSTFGVGDTSVQSIIATSVDEDSNYTGPDMPTNAKNINELVVLTNPVDPDEV